MNVYFVPKAKSAAIDYKVYLYMKTPLLLILTAIFCNLVVSLPKIHSLSDAGLGHYMTFFICIYLLNIWRKYIIRLVYFRKMYKLTTSDAEEIELAVVSIKEEMIYDKKIASYTYNYKYQFRTATEILDPVVSEYIPNELNKSLYAKYIFPQSVAFVAKRIDDNIIITEDIMQNLDNKTQRRCHK